MKFSLLILSIFLIFSGLFYADKVTLKNGNQILGKITKQTDFYIVIRLEGTRNRVQISRKEIEEIKIEKKKKITDPESANLTSKKSMVATIVLQKEKHVYEVGEPINLRFQLANKLAEPIKIRRKVYRRARTSQEKTFLTTFLALSDIIQVRARNKKKAIPPEPIYSQFPTTYKDFTIYPKESYREPASPEIQEKEKIEFVIDIQKRFLLEPGKYAIRGFYRNTVDKDGLWTGRVYTKSFDIQIVPSTGSRKIIPLNQRLNKELAEVRALYSKKEWDKAFAKISELESSFFDTHHLDYWRGKINYAKGNYEDSQRCLRFALSQKPDYYLATYELGRAYFKGRRFQDAYQTVFGIPKKAKKPVHFWLLANICQTGQLDYETAAFYYDEFAKAGGSHKDLERRKLQVSSKNNYEKFLTSKINEMVKIITQEKMQMNFGFRSKVDSFNAGEYEGRLEYLKDLYRDCGTIIYDRYKLIRR